MKKVFRMAYIYALVGILSGLFQLEYLKIMAFEGETNLAIIHTHLLSMGMLFMLVLLALVKLYPLDDNKWFKRFFLVYNVSFIITVTMIFVRGIVQVNASDVSSMINGMISGFSGIGHIGISVSFVFLFVSLSKVISETKT